MSVTIDLSSARDLIRWAREDAESFDAGNDIYFAGNPYAYLFEDDPKTGHVFLKIGVAPIPDELRKLASHAIWDLKHSLDHATYAAILAVTGAPPIKDTYFPWCDHPNALETKLTRPDKDGIVKYPPVLHDLFRSFEPYPTGQGYAGGNDQFVALNKLANTSKHAVVLRPGTRSFLDRFQGAAHTSGLVYITPDDWNHTKQQLTLGLFRKGSQMNMDLELSSFIEIGEVEALKGYPVGDVLEGFARNVVQVVDEIKAGVTAILAARG